MRMIDSFQAGMADELWYAWSALAAVREAQDSLRDAGVALSSLIADTAWSSDGVRALQEELITLGERVAHLAVELQPREWELSAVAT